MKNDHDLFIEYYEKFKDKLFTYLMYRVGFDRELSEDLLMDIVLKAYEKFDSYNQEKGSFKNWIFTISHNHLKNHWRDTKNKKTVDIEEIKENENLSVEQEIVEMDYIKAILEKMNKKYSELITLRYINNLSIEEIAKVLKKRRGAVRTGLTRATGQFKNLYNKIYNNEQP